MTKLVSIIIPLYNVERYVEECCRAVFEQTYDNCEFVFVDDCGTDNSLKLVCSLIEEYSHLKDRVKILHHECNKGIAVARRTGMENASGTYALYVDSDDVPRRDMVERLMLIAEANDADVVMCGYSKDPNMCNVDRPHVWEEDHVQCMMHDVGGNLPYVYLWNKLIKRDLFVQYPLYPSPKLRRSEDHYILSRLFFYAKKVMRTNEVLYFYRTVSSSLGHSWKNKAIPDTVSITEPVRCMNDFLEEHGFCNGPMQDAANGYRMNALKELLLCSDVDVLDRNKHLFDRIDRKTIAGMFKTNWPAALMCFLWKSHLHFLIPVARYFSRHGLYFKG